ncbi:Spy/CpxP family protein refolding chaperone [Agarilytica rhodophyticola]|uniref:Spy/CpxP family protein refolding chaperone n=1 Tax=Agarilytica rhodophyticola TaxID=1737490 RepID=UPI0013150CC2|nr:Spy/CpxP family protein refolding chaperone [Agarilytica rhodophyticola]
MKRVIWLIGSISVFVLALSAYANADSQHYFAFTGEQHIAKALALTDQQKSEIKRIRSELKNTRQELRSRARHKNLFALDPSDSDYSAQVSLLADEKAERMKTKMLAKANAEREIYQLLTPEQQEKFTALKQERRKVRKMAKRKARIEMKLRRKLSCHDTGDAICRCCAS